MGSCVSRKKQLTANSNQQNSCDRRPSLLSLNKNKAANNKANKPTARACSNRNRLESPAGESVKICVTEASAPVSSEGKEEIEPTESINDPTESKKSEPLTLSRHASLKLVANLRGSIRHRKVLRRPSDFSDLAHLETSFEGYTLSDREKNLLRNAYPSQDSSKDRAKMIARLQNRICSLASETQLSLFGTYETTNKRSGARQSANSVELADCVAFADDSSSLESFVFRSRRNTQEQTPDDTDLFKHSQEIINVLDMAISSLDHLDDSLGSYLTDMGARHTKLGDQLSPDLWELIALALIDCATTWKVPHDRVDTFCAWRIVVFFLINRIRSGYQVARQAHFPDVRRSKDALC